MKLAGWLSVLSPVVAAVVAFGAQSAWQDRPATIVLPPRLQANSPATLAVLDSGGHLAPGVAVDIGNGQSAATDATGRLSFTAPSNGAFVATAAGVSVAALVDESAENGAALSVAPAVSQKDRFAVCGAGFSGDLAANHVTINGDPAFVLASSPMCLVVLPQSRTMAGRVKVEIDSNGAKRTVATSLVAIDFVPPNPPLEPGRKGKFLVRADGTGGPLTLLIENVSPGVLHLTGGDAQEIRTTGGPSNQGFVEALAISSGKFSLRARLLPPPAPEVAERYIEIAAGLAPVNPGAQLRAIAANLEKHPRDLARPAAALDRLANSLPPGTVRVLVDAARDALEPRLGDQ